MDFDSIHIQRLKRYLNKIKRLYGDYAYKTILYALKQRYSKRPFKLTGKEAEAITQEFQDGLLKTINTATASAWVLANQKCNYVFRKGYAKPIHANSETLKTFQGRKIGDLTLSERVWNLTQDHKRQIEWAIDVALEEGKSAQQLSREVRQYLNNPDKLFRRVRDKYGNLVLSKNAEAFHPGQGVYRSSFKNAMRLASNEINFAYRDSEQLRFKQNPDVVATKIYLSPSHKIYDMCDDLQGIYPKNFEWNGWHLGCKCFRKAILRTDKEFKQDLPPEQSENYVAEPPKNFDKWVRENQDRIAATKTKMKWMGNVEGIKDELGVKSLMSKAKLAEKEFSDLLKDIANKYNGYFTPVNFKSEPSIRRKLMKELNGDVSKIKDSIRATVIVSKEKMDYIAKDLKNNRKFDRVKVQTPDKFMGYSGLLTNVKTQQGIFAEIQFNTEEMIFAKEKPSDAIKIIGRERWNQIRKRTNLDGGLGHRYYEEYRVLNKDLPEELEKMKHLEKLSEQYYKNFR